MSEPKDTLLHPKDKTLRLYYNPKLMPSYPEAEMLTVWIPAHHEDPDLETYWEHLQREYREALAEVMQEEVERGVDRERALTRVQLHVESYLGPQLQLLMVGPFNEATLIQATFSTDQAIALKGQLRDRMELDPKELEELYSDLDIEPDELDPKEQLEAAKDPKSLSQLIESLSQVF